MKRLISLSLALLMMLTVCLIPVPVRAAETPTGYYYNQLDGASKRIYELLGQMNLKSGTHTVDLVAEGVLESKFYEQDTLMALFSAGRDAFMLDNAALFYVDFDKLSITATYSGGSYGYTMGVGRDTTYFRSGFDRSNVEKAVSDFNSEVEKIAGSVRKDASRREKLRAAFEAVMEKNTYALEADAKPENVNYVRTPYGALVRGESVCEGYARALKAVLDVMGIENVLVQGYYDAEPIPGPHMWNYVKMDDNRWYLVDATMSDGKHYNDHFLLSGPHKLAAPYQAEGAISLTENAKVFNYPTLSPIDYQELSQAFEVSATGSTSFISYKGKGIQANREDGNYILCSYNGSNWHYLENFIRNTAWGQGNAPHPSQYDLSKAGDTAAGFNDYFSFPYLAVTKAAPPTAPEVYTGNDALAYCAFNLSNEMFDIQQFGTAVEQRKNPPFVVSRTPESSFVQSGDTVKVTIVYSEKLTVQDYLVAPGIELATTDTGSTVTDFNWEWGSDTITFTLHVGESFGYTISYFVYPQNLKGAASGEAPDAVAFTRMNLHKFSCPKVSTSINSIHASTPALISDSNLAENEWTDKNGKPIANYASDRLALVASPIPQNSEAQDTMVDEIEKELGSGAVKAAQTFDISLTLCSGQVDYITGKRVKVYVPFPAGYTYESIKDTTFKAYHFDKDGNAEEIDCVVAAGGIIMMCDAFSPFAVVAVAKEPVKERTIITHADGNGFFPQELVAVKENGTASITVTANSGYRIDKVLLNGEEQNISKLRTVNHQVTIPVSYDQLKDSGNTLEASFVLKEISTEVPGETVTVTAEAPDAVELTAPDTWRLGENVFTVTGQQPFIVAVTQDKGASYTQLFANSETPNAYNVNITGDSKIVVALLGDADQNGVVDEADLAQLKAACLKQTSPSALGLLIYDINGSGRVTNADMTRLKAALLNDIPLTWNTND